ncbi:MAG: hypothetical protein M3O15_12090 [Acidobacteriota bacterium]|nr:hypothetical protein [Acidobacteriota bacterium]
MRKLHRVLGFTLLLAGTATWSTAAPPQGTEAEAQARAALAPHTPLLVGPPHFYPRNEVDRSDDPDDAAKRFHPSRDILMTYHGGAVLTSSKTVAIFWGPDWNDPAFANDIVTGIDTLLGAFGDSRYAASSTEYTGSNGRVTRSSTYLGHMIDPSPVPAQPLAVDMVGSEACKMANDNPDPDALYLVYTSTGAGRVRFCAYHSYGFCRGGAPIQIAFMPNLAGVAGCDIQDRWTGHSEPLSALANATAHELSEVITDPRGGGWYDGRNGENGDKCAYSFLGPVTLNDGSVWKLQMLWSNRAYGTASGAPNLIRQRGCIQGR